MLKKYLHRKQAGEVLATYLKAYAHRPDVLILALPRGGVPIAYEISKALSLPLDILIVRKLGVPGQEEFAMGAIASGGVTLLNEDTLQQLNLSQEAVERVILAEQQELQRREALYRQQQPFPVIDGKTILLVDDGIATGSTLYAAIQALHQHKPAHIIIAVPVAAEETCKEMRTCVDAIICPLQVKDLQAIGLWYDQFPQLSDEEVKVLLQKAHGNRAEPS